MNTQNKLYFYRIECTYIINDFQYGQVSIDKKDLIRGRDINDAFELFADKYHITKKDIVHYKINCDGDLQYMGEINPYTFGKCNWSVFKAVNELPLDATIKISAIKNKTIPLTYNERTIGESLRRLESDGYIKCESINPMGEKIYIKKGQVKE